MTSNLVTYNKDQKTITGINTNTPGALFVEITIRKSENGYELANQTVFYLKDYRDNNNQGLTTKQQIIGNLIGDVNSQTVVEEGVEEGDNGQVEGGYDGGFKKKTPLLIENNLDIDLNDVYKLPTTIYGKTGNNRKSKNKTLNIRK